MAKLENTRETLSGRARSFVLKTEKTELLPRCGSTTFNETFLFLYFIQIIFHFSHSNDFMARSKIGGKAF